MICVHTFQILLQNTILHALDVKYSPRFGGGNSNYIIIHRRLNPTAKKLTKIPTKKSAIITTTTTTKSRRTKDARQAIIVRLVSALANGVYNIQFHFFLFSSGFFSLLFGVCVCVCVFCLSVRCV